MTEKTVVIRQCKCCGIEKEMDKFWNYKKEGVTYFKNYCIECEGKERCHSCERNKFYGSKGLIDTVKCKDCYSIEI